MNTRYATLIERGADAPGFADAMHDLADHPLEFNSIILTPDHAAPEGGQGLAPHAVVMVHRTGVEAETAVTVVSDDVSQQHCTADILQDALGEARHLQLGRTRRLDYRGVFAMAEKFDTGLVAAIFYMSDPTKSVSFPVFMGTDCFSLTVPKVGIFSPDKQYADRRHAYDLFATKAAATYFCNQVKLELVNFPK